MKLMDDPQIELVRVLQWEWIGSNDVRNDPHPTTSTRVRPKVVEARCPHCNFRWIEKRKAIHPVPLGGAKTSNDRIHLTCPSCNEPVTDYLLDLDHLSPRTF